MPSESDHISKAQHNRKFADACPPKFHTSAGWALTALFYSALHYVEAYNGRYNKHCSNHNDVKDSIVRNPELEAIFDDYTELLDYSWNARYQAKKYGEAEIREAQICQESVANHVSNLLR